MWNRKDWICMGVSAAAVFGVVLVEFNPSSATADDPVPVAAPIKVPTLTLDGVSVAVADSAKVPGMLEVKDSTVFIKPGALPTIELQATNKNGFEETIKVLANVATTNVPNLMSRVPMPVSKPTSQWTQEITIDLKANEVTLVQLSPHVNLKPWSAATLTLSAGSQMIDALTLSTAPNAMRFTPVSIDPATQPSGTGLGVSSVDNK